ncbi:MAG: cell wall hydrolase, partial [Clostridiales bacterium]|nr:cell wall hydrolase [Clostridiales bacterium]
TIAKIMYSECRGIPSDTEKACLVWVILNRVDAGYGSSIAAVATAPSQFGYNSKAPVWDDLLRLSKDVLSRWEKEKRGEVDTGRVLPKDYLWYSGDGVHNYFRNSYSGGSRWDYSLESPYAS